MNRHTTCLLAFTFVAAPAFADNCANPQTQTGMNICASASLQKADAALNATYQQLLAKISPAGRDSLRRAENSWLAYRDNQCDFETLGSAGGSIRPLELATCETILTQAQTARLTAQLTCKEGDSCGGQ